MRHLRWIILAVAVVAVMLGVLFLPGHLGLPPFVSEELVALEPDPREAHSIPEDNMMEVPFGKTQGAPEMARVFIQTEPIGPYAYSLRTYLSHEEGRRFESMRLSFRFPPGTPAKLALVALEGDPWNDPVFARDPSDGSIDFWVGHLGAMGIGSVGTEYVLQHFTQGWGGKPAFTLHVTATLRGNGLLQLKEHVVDADIEVVLPGQSTSDLSCSPPDPSHP